MAQAKSSGPQQTLPLGMEFKESIFVAEPLNQSDGPDADGFSDGPDADGFTEGQDSEGFSAGPDGVAP